jgi:hypothetical protein
MTPRQKRTHSANKWRRKWMLENSELWLLEQILLTNKFKRDTIISDLITEGENNN